MQSEYVPGLVSVIVPVYNREKMVGKTLDSILCQSYSPVEIVAVNDGSTDGSLAVLSDYARRHPGKILVLDQLNSGQVRARNKGIVAARGEYIAFLDSDDTWERDKLSLQIPLLKGNVGLVYCGINEMDPNGLKTCTVLPELGMRGDIYRSLLVRNRMTGGSVVVARMALDRVGCFDEGFSAAENWDLWIRISRQYQVDYVNEALVNYLKHSGNMSQDSARMAQGAWSILRKHLPVKPTEESLESSYREAYANYYYSLGVQYFGKNEYKDARKMFLLTWEYIPYYRDSLTRVCRTMLGKNFNSLISYAKRIAG